MSLQVFEEYRDKMLSIMGEAELSLRHQPPADTLLLDLARNRMARIITAYHLFADRELFRTTPAMETAQQLRLKALAAECGTLAQDYRNFARDCTIDPVLGRWAGYRIDALAMMARVRKHLASVEMEALAGVRPMIKASETARHHRTAA
jgi:hypothetical protein